MVAERGIVYSISNTNLEIDGTNVTKVVNSATTDIFSASITGLTPSTTYYFRAYAINRSGTSYGSVMSFITSQVLAPNITISPATLIATVDIAITPITGSGLNLLILSIST